MLKGKMNKNSIIILLLFATYVTMSDFNLSVQYIFLGLSIFIAIKLASDYKISNQAMSIIIDGSDKNYTLSTGITMPEFYGLINEAYRIFVSKAASKGIALKFDDILDYLKSDKSIYAGLTKDSLIYALHYLSKLNYLFFDGENISVSKDIRLSIASRSVYDVCMKTGRYALARDINSIKKKNNVVFIEKLHYLKTKKSRTISHIIIPLFKADRIRFTHIALSFGRTNAILSLLTENKIIDVIRC